MASTVGRFVERVTSEAKRIDTLFQHRLPPLTEQKFAAELRIALKQAAEWGLKMGHDGVLIVDDDKIQQELFQNSKTTRAIQETYKDMRTEFSRMCEVRATENWADSVERLKTLIYRVATAAGIAIIIFIAGVASYVTGIPLPMLRVG